MATNDRQADYPIRDRLLEEGYAFGFFQAVRLLEGLQGGHAAPGEGGPPWEEGIRFRPSASLGFPAADVQRIEQTELPGLPNDIYLMTVNFMGLYGVNAPTPTYFTEMICASDSDEDSLRCFLDIFNHRLISLFYRAWKKYRYHITFLSGAKDPISGYLLSLCGLGTKRLRQAADLPSICLLRYAGLLSQQPRSVTGLRGLLADYFDGVPVDVQQFALRWIKISESHQNRLGVAGSPSVLGVDLSLGERTRDRSGKFRVTLGPLSSEQFESFLPGGRQFEVLSHFVFLYAPDRMEFDIELVIKGEEIPHLWLAATGTARLGYTTWLMSEQRENAAIVLDTETHWPTRGQRGMRQSKLQESAA